MGEIKKVSAEVEQAPEAAVGEPGSMSAELVSTYGDDAPKTSPLVILPVMRHPIFPGFMVYLVILDVEPIFFLTCSFI